jgi:hypothetical protein
VYECTDQNNPIKQQIRQNEGTFRFFYGSINSRFWVLYRDFVDNTILLLPNSSFILYRLIQRQITISDNIISCERHGFSLEDSKLIRITYNRQGIQELIKHGVSKIICTSKGVLNDLERKIILQGNKPFGKIDNLAIFNFQQNFITRLGGNNIQITSPIAKVFLIDTFEVTALAIFSPGSPQRQLAKFGFNGDNWEIYADNYISAAFNWLSN